MEEVINLISRDRPLMASIGRTAVEGLFLEKLEDVYSSRGLNAVVEGAAFTNPALSQPARIFMHVQHFAKWGQVTDEQRISPHYNGDPMAFQVRKKMDELLNDIEHTGHRGSAITGATDAARQFDGLLNIPTSGDTFTSSSGTTFTEQVMVDLLQVFRNKRYAAKPNQAYVGPFLKRTISEFSTRITRNVDAADRLQALIIERHVSDFGDLDVIYSEDQLAATSKTTQGNSVVFLDSDYFRFGWRKAPTVEVLSRDGFRDRFQLDCHVTLLFDTRKAAGGGTGYVSYIGQT